MNKPLVASLLVAWCAFVVAPAWIVYFAFRGIDADTPIVGPLIAIWIVGYLLQFGTFMAVARKAGDNSVVGWLLASTTPFVADWTVPVAPWSPAAVAVVVGGYAVWFYTRLTRSDDLQRNGIPATGTVLEVKQPIMNTIINSVYLRRTCDAAHRPCRRHPALRGRVLGHVHVGRVCRRWDAVFTLRVDPKNPKHFETTDGTSVAAQPSTPSPPRSTVADALPPTAT